MYELLHHPDLMLFHFSLLTLVILSMVETLGYFLNLAQVISLKGSRHKN